MTDAEMAALRDAERDEHMKNAYGEMLALSRNHPECRALCACWRIERADGAMVGDLCFKGPPVRGAVEIGYGIGEAFRCKGYATEAVREAAEWAFGQKGVFAVEAQIEKGNAASEKVLLKAGFLPAGQGEEGPLFRKEKPPAQWISLCLCLGISLGLVLGALCRRLLLGVCLGIGIGMAVGAALNGKESEARDSAKNAKREGAK